jgi:hypothetical protein
MWILSHFHLQTEQNSQSADHGLENCSVVKVFEKTEYRKIKQGSKAATVLK